MFVLESKFYFPSPYKNCFPYVTKVDISLMVFSTSNLNASQWVRARRDFYQASINWKWQLQSCCCSTFHNANTTISEKWLKAERKYACCRTTMMSSVVLLWSWACWILLKFPQVMTLPPFFLRLFGLTKTTNDLFINSYRTGILFF